MKGGRAFGKGLWSKREYIIGEEEEIMGRGKEERDEGNGRKVGREGERRKSREM